MCGEDASLLAMRSSLFSWCQGGNTNEVASHLPLRFFPNNRSRTPARNERHEDNAIQWRASQFAKTVNKSKKLSSSMIGK